MNMKSIWSKSDMRLKHKLGYTREELARRIAASLPIRIRWHVTMQMLGAATKDSKNVPATTVDEILVALERPKTVY